MKINLPLIAGTPYDNALNEMIETINRDNNPEQAKWQLMLLLLSANS